MTGRPELYVYLECPNCKDIFRMFKSSYRERIECVLNAMGEGTTVCPTCSHFTGICNYERVTKSKWKKSNELKPDEAIVHKPIRNKQESSALMGCTIIAKDSEMRPNKND